MDYFDDQEQAAAYAGEALQLMAKNGVPSTPENFTVWYTHVSGRDTDLSDTLETLSSSGQTFTAVQNAAIVGSFIDAIDATDAVHETSQKIEESVSAVLEFLRDANDGVESYGESLETNLGAMAGAESLESLRRAVETLVSDTKGMSAQNSALRDRLQDSSTEIQGLREHLEDVRKEASTDALTGIANRKFFDSTLRQETRQATESGDGLRLLLGDIDHFKRFNDNFGHQTGDQVLKLVGMILKQAAAKDGTAARYGGEEFAIILPRADLETAKKLAEYVRVTVASKRIRKKSTGEDFGNITMSIGVSLFKQGEPMADLIQRADQGLYHAKGAGRDRVVTEQDMKGAASAA